METKIWYLKQCHLFDGLTAAEAARLDQRALVRNHARSDLIYSPTEPGQSIMLLARGRVKIKNLTYDGKETILAFIEEGEVFGELALLEDDLRQDYAEAATACTVLLLPRQELLELMANRPDIALSVTKLIGLRRRRVENRLSNILFLSSRDRMLRLLAELAENYGQWTAGRCQIRLKLSHQDLAGLIGVTRETATLTLTQLRAEGLIQIDRRQITVLHPDRLVAGGRATDERRPSQVHRPPVTSGRFS